MKRITAFLISAVFTGFCLPAWAGDLINEPHAMVYYQIPFSGSKQDSGHQFGLRLDRTVHDSRASIEFARLLQQPAMMDFRVGRDGVETFKVAGTDLLARWRAYQAAEEEAAKSESGNGEATGEETKEEDKLTVDKILNNAPAGVLIGAAIGVVLLVGAGG